MKFAKLFELENGEQVLFTKEYNEEDDKHELKIRIESETLSLSTYIGSGDENTIDEALEKVTIETADAFYNDLSEMILD